MLSDAVCTNPTPIGSTMSPFGLGQTAKREWAFMKSRTFVLDGII